MINNSLTETTIVDLPKEAEVYTLSGGENIRSSVMYLNAEALGLIGETDIPELLPAIKSAGKIALAPGTCTFIVL